ncbi:MAG: acyltransferase [Ferruginibacter sp.]|nr:acyltransferase [Ferruginibacter sp.]
MNPLNPLFAVIIFIIAFITAYLTRLKYKVNAPDSRNDAIDGMRGFLAIGVFIHHSCIWHQFIQIGKWQDPGSNLYTQLGQTSVLLFFMITSFLFISKLINAKEKGFAWPAFFLSRTFRLVPLYIFSKSLIIIFIAFISLWQSNTPQSALLKIVFPWLSFRIHETPAINNYENSFLVNCGVYWSLHYEWLFYFSLPLIALLILKVKPKKEYIILSLLAVTGFYFFHSVAYYYIIPFIAGAIAPILRKYTSFHKKIKDVHKSILTIICLFLIGLFPSANNIYCILLISIVFTCIALGATIFGLLKNATLKFLGEICYSTYLLHGIIIFTVFYMGLGLDSIRHWTPLEYCLVVFAITPIVVIISIAGFKYIEKPFIDKAKKISQQLKTGNKISAAKESLNPLVTDPIFIKSDTDQIR